jgi:CheY-specific phosphatase CheX
MGGSMTAGEWMDAIVHSANEFAMSMLGVDGVHVVEPLQRIPSSGGSAIISLVGDNTAIELGLSLEPDACQDLARGLLGMSAEEGDLPDDEVADALSEVANIVAGQVKSYVADRVTGVNIGLPMFIRGELCPAAETQSVVMAVRLGEIPATLVVLAHNN